MRVSLTLPTNLGAARRVISATAVAFLCAVALAQPSEAVPLPVGTSSADDIIFNFDFTANVPPPPYVGQIAVALLGGWDAGEFVNMDYFGDLNGVTFVSGVGVNGGGPSFTFSITGSLDLDDGILSVGMRVAPGGQVDLISLTVTERTARGEETSITVVPTGVPEPATLVLFAAGLAALGVIRVAHGMSRRRTA